MRLMLRHSAVLLQRKRSLIPLAEGLRRSQIILASARKQTAIQIGRELNCDDQTVRNVIKQFNAHGLEVLKAKSNRPHTIKATFSEDKIEPLKELLHQSPRNFGKETSIWTLE